MHPVAKKYSVHPIYNTRLFLDGRDESLPFYNGVFQVPSTISFLLDLMTDFLLQDLENLTNEGLVQILSNEKKEMFGEQRVPAIIGAVNRLGLRSVAGSVTEASKSRGKKCNNMKS